VKIKHAARKVAKAVRVAAIAHIALVTPAPAPPDSEIMAANPDYAVVKAEFPPGHDKRRRRKINYVIRPRKRKK
jgi:hypothetical protein